MNSKNFYNLPVNEQLKEINKRTFLGASLEEMMNIFSSSTYSENITFTNKLEEEFRTTLIEATKEVFNENDSCLWMKTKKSPNSMFRACNGNVWEFYCENIPYFESNDGVCFNPKKMKIIACLNENSKKNQKKN